MSNLCLLIGNRLQYIRNKNSRCIRIHKLYRTGLSLTNVHNDYEEPWICSIFTQAQSIVWTFSFLWDKIKHRCYSLTQPDSSKEEAEGLSHLLNEIELVLHPITISSHNKLRSLPRIFYAPADIHFCPMRLHYHYQF